MEIPSYKSDGDINLYNLGDLHRGNPAFCHDLLDKVIDTIGGDPSAFWVSTGDMFEVALIGSLGNTYKAKSLNDEYYSLGEELKPIKHKCLGIVSSNHHTRFERATGMSLDKLFCSELDIPDKYLGDFGIIRIKCGEAPYYIAMHHGVGGGRKRGGKTNNLQELANIFNGADVYMEGHGHAFDHFIDEICYIDKKRCKWIRYKAYFCQTGHFMDYFNSYGAEKKYKPTPMGCAKLKLYARDIGRMEGKKVRVELFD